MLQNGIVDAESNESVLMVESANAYNGTRWFRSVSATRSALLFSNPKRAGTPRDVMKKMRGIFIAFSALKKNDAVWFRRGIINRCRCKYRDWRNVSSRASD